MPTPQERYTAALHAMQSGVATEIEIDPTAAGTSPKHLRVGVNSAMVEHAALTHLLIEKGIITHDEYIEALAKGMEGEAERYRQILTAKLGTNVTLA